MAVVLCADSVRSCFGDAEATFDAWVAGRCGVGPLRGVGAVNVGHAYHAPGTGVPFAASAWLAECVREVAVGVDPARERVRVVVGTGLRETRTVELATGEPPAVERLHFGAVVREVLPGVRVTTVVNACSAGGHALALGQDLLEAGEADVVVVAATDSVSESMLACVGRAAPGAEVLRPFDAERAGVVLGEGAVAVVLRRSSPAPLAEVVATGLSCDAHHPTAPHPEGIARAMRDALTRAGVRADEVDLVVAHGSGTALNDPAEAEAIRAVLGDGPVVTACKGAVGHTSGGAALVAVVLAARALRAGVVPPVVGLRTPAVPLRLVTAPTPATPRVAQVDAFGFGGVNAVTVLRLPSANGPSTTPSTATDHVGITAWGVHVPGPAPRVLLDGVEAEAVAGLGGACPAARAKEVLGRGLLGVEPATRLALCAVRAALGPPGAPDPRTAVVVSANLGTAEAVDRIVRTVRDESWRHVSPMDAPNASSNVIATTIAIRYGFGGPNLLLCSGAGSAWDAVDVALGLVRAGRADRVVLVGAEPDDPVATRLHGGALVAGAACVVLTPGGGSASLVVPPPDATSLELPDWDAYGATGIVALAVAAALEVPGTVAVSGVDDDGRLRAAGVCRAG
ncbi:beta-ketoacyl synthase N-terminal-like domain-containing protein [Actinosynnema sp. NPDC020468]|uniref:beta-ketoacyl synthase N-terminal-like domain-containing protein n=1 Tax=Actinosynnema sp. NPDC020468 TaxID=3154488 RepID=UPI0033E0146A